MSRRLIGTGAFALTLLAVFGGTALAQNRGEGWHDEHRGWQNHDDWDHGHHSKFDDHDRDVTRDWYLHNRNHLGRGWTKRDRLSRDMERRIHAGARLDYDLRRQMYWLPADLTRRYGPAPRGYRYAIIGGNIVMLDSDYYVRDVFRIDILIH